MIKNFYYLFLCVLFGCCATEKKPLGAVFIGEIVNPTDKYVVLYKDEVALDSALLDEHNMFYMELADVEEGLYHFDHSPELQYVYLERGDSLLVRLNTVDFDESLIFSGRGGEINNFLLDVFLKEEEEGPLVDSYYTLEPKEFGKKIDSLREGKINLLNDLLSEMALSDKALEIAKASIDYNSYINKEKYPFYHKKKTGRTVIHDLDPGFYDYRKQVTYNNKNLTYFRPYYNFMKYHFGNLSYMACDQNCATAEHGVKNNLHYNRHSLKLIDSLVKEKNLRDNLFRNVAMDYFLKVRDNMENNKIFIDEFLKRSGDNQHIDEITGLYEGIKKMQPHNILPDLNVYTVSGNKTTLSEIAKEKNVVFYFWSATQARHFENVTNYVAGLTAKHPEYTFIGISWNTDPVKWISLLDSRQLDKDRQYRSTDFEVFAKTLVFDDYNKAIIAKDGVIVDAFANLFTSF